MRLMQRRQRHQVGDRRQHLGGNLGRPSEAVAAMHHAMADRVDGIDREMVAEPVERFADHLVQVLGQVRRERNIEDHGAFDDVQRQRRMAQVDLAAPQPARAGRLHGEQAELDR